MIVRLFFIAGDNNKKEIQSKIKMSQNDAETSCFYLVFVNKFNNS